tara:strand:+ start:255 stop:476 length:222 start_codon:yes stop_codon:yes gene_type:complete
MVIATIGNEGELRILVARFEDRLHELDRKISSLKTGDKRFSSDVRNLKDLYNLNLRIARTSGIIPENDSRVFK